MEEYSKLWENEVFMTWKAGSPGVNVGLAMNFICTCRTEYDAQSMILDISNVTIIRYLAAQVDEEDASDSTGEIPDDDDNDNDVDEDIQQMATEIGTKSDDSSFHGSGVGSIRIDALMGPGVKWMGEMPPYQMTAPAISSRSGMHTSSCNVEAAGQSFDTFIKHHAAGSGVGDVTGSQALLQDFTTPQELESLRALANEQVAIAHRFDTKFSNTAFTLLKKVHEAFIMTSGITQKFVDDMATASLNFIRDATTYEEELLSSEGIVFAAGLTGIRNRIAELIREASELEVVYEESQKKFAGVLKQVEEEVRKYLETQSMVDSTVFMDKSFDNLRQYSNSFNISPFVPVVVGTVVTHHALLTSLRVNVSHFPLKIFLLLLESDATMASGQMALLQYMTQQSITVREGQAKIVPALRASTGHTDPTIESDHSYMAPWSRRPKLEQSVIAPSIQDKKEAHLSKDLGPPPPPLPLAEEPHTPKGRDACMSGSMAALMAQFQQCHDSRSREATPHGTPEKVPPMAPMAFSTPGKVATPRETPTKETPRKSEQMPSKKGLMPDTTPEPPVMKQRTSSPSNDQGDDSEHGDTSENKIKKKEKKERKSVATAASDSEADETEEQQEKCQWAKKWKHELQALVRYQESHNIFLHNLPPHGSSSHIEYLESRIMEADSGFFIKSIKAWRHELETQSQGVGQNADAARCRLLILESKAKERLSTMYNIQAEYLVEVFKYPGTRDRIPPNAPDGYGSMPMIGLYGLVDPYSITQITTTRSGLMTEDGEKKSTSKCYCSLCNYVVQNHPSVNNHFWTHLHLSLLCTINGCFHIEHGCNNMWTHVTKEHGIPSTHAVAVLPSRRSKKKK